MRRLALFLSVFLLVGSSRADITNDVSEIRSRLEAIRNYLQATQENRLSQILNNVLSIEDDIAYIWENLLQNLTVDSTGALLVRDSASINRLTELLYSLSDDILPAILDIQTVLGSGDITSEILNLNALLQGVAADSSLIWSILDAAEDGGLIRTDPDYSGLQNLLQNLGVSINNFSDLLEELEDWHPDITGEVTATLDGPVVIGEMPEIDLSDIDFSYFDDWRDDFFSLFGYWSSFDLAGYKWSPGTVLGKGTVDDVAEDIDSSSGNWFEQVLYMLQFGVNQEGQINRSVIELMAKIAPTNVSEVTSQLENNLTGLESQIAQLNQMDIENDSSLAKLTTSETVVKDYAKFGRLSSMFSGSGSLGSYIHIHFGDTVDGNGNAMELSGDIPVDEFGGFFDKCRQGASIMWWLLTFMFSAVVTFRVFALFRKVNDTFFRMPIGFGA